MDPVRNLQRNDLKRPRLGSLDAETHRPPPGPPGGAHHAQLQFRPDAHLSAGAQFSPSNSFHPAATAHWIDRLPLGAQNHQQLIPSPSQVLRSNLSMPSTTWPIPSPPTQTYITGGNNIENHGNFNFYHQTSPAHAAHDQCLTQLHNHAASNAIHTSSAVDNQGICMPGTRAFTLQHLQSLVGSTENDDPDIIWMHGPAGSGKSAIMRTMANALDKDGVLLGSFFFFRSDAQRNTSVPFIPTMASQSFISCPATQPHIRNAVHSQPHIFSQSIRHQLHHLFETPLKLAAGHEPKWTAQSPLVIVIDGLDECADADRQIEIIKAMHQLASTIRSSTNLRVKILIASRLEKPIQDEFELYGDSVTIVELDPSDANIDLFYDIRLDEIRRRKGLPESWPSLKQIQWLKRKTSGQYSFAHISMGFLAGGDPVERLKMIENGVGTHGLEPFAALDALYATIFQQIPPEMAENALLLVRFWLVYDDSAAEKTTHAVERMFSLPSGFSFRLLPYLSSILYVDEGDTPPHFSPYHATLDDFLSDRTRAGKYSLFLDRLALLTAIVKGMLGLCIVPLALPLDEETANTWFGDYDYLVTFINLILEQDMLVCLSPLPGITAICDQLSLLLPTMDLYAFGYCERLLSILFESSLEYQLVSNPVSRLFDQIHSIQQLRFAMYKALEARGDSGLGLFGLLVLFASGSFATLYSGIDSEVEEWSIPVFIVEDMVAHVVQACVDPDIPGSECNMEEPLPLFAQARQLAITTKLSSRLEFKESYKSHSAGGYALFSTRFGDKSSKLSLCLSQTITMFLDLPLGRTRIQGQILECIACPDHAKLYPQCSPCTLNLQWMQIAVIHSAVDFLCALNLSVSERWNAVIDAQTFVRCCRFRNAVQEIHWPHSKYYFDNCMSEVGAVILNKLEVEGGTNTPVVDNLRTMVSSLHERHDVHCRWGDDLDQDYDRCTGFKRVPRDNCWVCSGIRRES